MGARVCESSLLASYFHTLLEWQLDNDDTIVINPVLQSASFLSSVRSPVLKNSNFTTFPRHYRLRCRKSRAWVKGFILTGLPNLYCHKSLIWASHMWLLFLCACLHPDGHKLHYSNLHLYLLISALAHLLQQTLPACKSPLNTLVYTVAAGYRHSTMVYISYSQLWFIHVWLESYIRILW